MFKLMKTKLNGGIKVINLIDEAKRFINILDSDYNLEEIKEMIISWGNEAVKVITYVQKTNRNVLSPFLKAVKIGDLELVKFLLKNYEISLELADKEGRTALYMALCDENMEITKFLIGKGANIHASNKYGTRVFDMLLRTGDIELIEEFISKGCELNYKNSKNATTLHWAASSNNIELVKRILSETPFTLMDCDDQGDMPIDFCKNGEMFKFFLETEPKLEINRYHSDGYYSIHKFIHSGIKDIVEIMLDEGVDINLKAIEGNSVMHCAVSSQNLELIQMLIDRGGDVNVRNRYNYRPLHWAAEYGNLDVIKLLVLNKAKVNIKTNVMFIIRETKTPLYLAIENGHIEAAKYLIQNKAKVDELNDSSNATALSQAASLGQTDIVKFLLENGASPNGVSKRGMNDYYKFPLAAAANKEIVELLINEGADVNARNSNYSTALHELASSIKRKDLNNEAGKKKLEALKALIAHGADPNALDYHNRKPLSLAECKEVGELLIEAAKNSNEIAPLSEKEAIYQQVQDDYKNMIDTVVCAVVEDKYGYVDLREESKNTTGFGKEIFELSSYCDKISNLDTIISLLNECEDQDVKYISPDTYYNDETSLHRIIHSASKSDYSDPKEFPSLSEYNKAIQLIISKGADVNAVETLFGDSPLHKAAKVSDSKYSSAAEIEELKKMLEMLIEAGADINKKNREDGTPLDFIRHKELIEYMIGKGAEFGSYNGVLFDLVTYENAEEILNTLIKYGVNLNCKNKKGATPIMESTTFDSLDTLLLLLSKGANIEETDNEGRNLLHYACCNGAFKTISDIMKNKRIDLNKPDNFGQTPLYELLQYTKSHWDKEVEKQAKKDMEEMAVKMAENGASIDCLDYEEYTPLDYAQTKKLQGLLKKAAKIYSKNVNAK